MDQSSPTSAVARRVKPGEAVVRILRAQFGSALPLTSVAGEDAVAAVKAAYRAGRDAEKKRAASVVKELEEVLEWARVEKTALRPQEIASIQGVLARYRA